MPAARVSWLSIALASLLPWLSAAPAWGAPGWQETLDRVAPGVVVLRVASPRAFDTDLPSYATATGFVVDAKRGLILTNRHVVTPGPVVAEAIFLNNEEVPVRAVYRDPVHDFGFFRYEPDDVRFMQPAELPLAPEGARVGTEVRVIGNDAGEKLSILTGTLARLDRDSPDYGRSRYSDFNTFYYQAASATSGGSSGSPVIDIHGRVVALNAGGKRRSAASFYLPLDRVVRALDHLRRGEAVPRGTIQTVFRHLSYDELRRLGLRPETERNVRSRFERGTGLLTVREVVPGGPADGRLEVGDVLVRVDGEPVNAFLPLEARLDERVGGSVRLAVERAGEPLELELAVQDLDDVSPAEYLEVGGAIVHPLSYQQARNHDVAVEGLYLASSGSMFALAGLPRNVVITRFDDAPVATLDDLEARLARLPHGARIPVRYFPLERPRSEEVTIVSMDRRWYPIQRCARDDESGRWPCRPAASGAPAARATLPPLPIDAGDARPQRDLAPSLVLVRYTVPYRIAGVHGDTFIGTGVVFDAERGLVLVDRETVPVGLGDVRITVGEATDVPGEVVYLHPTHNLAVVSYEPALLEGAGLRSAVFEDDPLEVGEAVWVVGYDERGVLGSRRTRVSGRSPVRVPPLDPPRFRDSNLDALRLDDEPATVGAVLSDGKGRVRGFWAAFSTEVRDAPDAFFAGISAARMLEVIEPLRAGRAVAWRDLGAEFVPVSLADARALDAPAADVEAIAAADRARRVLSVRRLVAGSPAAQQLLVGDLIVALDGRPAPTVAEVEHAAQRGDVVLDVVRDGRRRSVPLTATPLSGRGTDRVLLWAGSVLHAPHRAVATLTGDAPIGVYVAWFWFGSPANRYRLSGTIRIVAVDGVPTPDLDSFLASVKGRPDRSSVRLHTMDLEGTVRVKTLTLDTEYWPTVELRRGANGWERIEH